MAPASTTTTHMITAPLRYPIGSADDRDDVEVATDIVYSYRPGGSGTADMDTITATPVYDHPEFPVDRDILKEIADDWLNDEGFLRARDRAEHERHGDYE